MQSFLGLLNQHAYVSVLNLEVFHNSIQLENIISLERKILVVVQNLRLRDELLLLLLLFLLGLLLLFLKLLAVDGLEVLDVVTQH